MEKIYTEKVLIFGILGIFSAKYRYYFKASMHCMKRQLTLRPCDTSFDQELKAKISASLSKKSPALGGFVFKRFVALSWIFLILMIFSVAAMGIGVYNYVIYDNCNGPNSNDFCIFGAFNNDVNKIKPIGPDDDPFVGNPDASLKIIEVGCFSCPYTREAEAFRNKLLEKYDGNVTFIFRAMPLPKHELSFERAEAADCALEQDKYWEYHDKLFEYQDNITIEKLSEIAQEIGLDTTQFSECFDSKKYLDEVQKDYDDAVAAGIFATPTYFVNGKPIVGLKAFADFEDITIGEIKGSCPA